MEPKAGVFCHNALGDGINCLVLSNNLHLNGWQVDTYQNSIGPLQNWFPHLPVYPYPKIEELPRILTSYDWFFVVQNDTDPFVLELIRQGKERFPQKIKVIYLYPSPNIVNERYYADCLTNSRASVAENMRNLCLNVMKLPKSTKSNGFTPPVGLVSQKYPMRIVIHPTSGRLARNWPKEKFVKLALHLKKLGFELVFVPGGPKEQEEWRDVEHLGLKVMGFETLDALARYLYESGYLIGNDSGLGHLASALQIPTVTICRRKTLADLWAPSFSQNVVIAPYSWIPNIRGLRLRDVHWKKFISVGKVLRGFKKLVI